MGLSSAILRRYSPLKNWSAEILANDRRPALGSASDKKNSVNLPLVQDLKQILTQNDAAAKRIWVHLHLPYADLPAFF